jgi:hypothetical protein
MTRARIGRARRERVGSSGGFGRGDGHEPARELVGVRLVGGEGETAVTRGWGKRPLYTVERSSRAPDTRMCV